jgi:hypothetical protein
MISPSVPLGQLLIRRVCVIAGEAYDARGGGLNRKFRLRSEADGTNYAADTLLRADAKQIAVKVKNLD